MVMELVSIICFGMLKKKSFYITLLMLCLYKLILIVGVVEHEYVNSRLPGGRFMKIIYKIMLSGKLWQYSKCMIFFSIGHF